MLGMHAARIATGSQLVLIVPTNTANTAISPRLDLNVATNDCCKDCVGTTSTSCLGCSKKTDTEGTANLGYTAVMMPSAVKDARKTLSNIAAVQFLYCDDCVAATICT